MSKQCATFPCVAVRGLALWMTLWPTSLEFELVIVIFTLWSVQKPGLFEKVLQHFLTSPPVLYRSYSSSSLQTLTTPSGSTFPPMGILHPQYLSYSHGKQIEFLTSFHFDSCQEKELQRFSPTSPTHRHVVFTSAQPSDTLPGENAASSECVNWLRDIFHLDVYLMFSVMNWCLFQLIQSLEMIKRVI